VRALLVWIALAVTAARVHADDSIDAALADTLRIDRLQSVGTHNSYKLPLAPEELALLRRVAPDEALTIDYGHRPLDWQLEHGARALELDLMQDPDPGRYADPLWPRLVGRQPQARPDPGQHESLERRLAHPVRGRGARLGERGIRGHRRRDPGGVPARPPDHAGPRARRTPDASRGGAGRRVAHARRGTRVHAVRHR
jgi:hypothetical protein